MDVDSRVSSQELLSLGLTTVRSCFATQVLGTPSKAVCLWATEQPL